MSDSAPASPVFGIDRLLAEPHLRAPLAGQRIALLSHPAAVTVQLEHSLDALARAGLPITAAFGPQHGLRGDKQDNMVESPDYTDPIHNIPVHSLYGDQRRPRDVAMADFDVLLIDLQDLGCRIYTFITSLLYMLEAAAKHGKVVYVLDRPNPVGRIVEGLALRKGWESFVGAAPIAMRHGLTLGEMGQYFIAHYGLDVEYHVITMGGWQAGEAPDFGWPSARAWLNPSPNAASLNMARAYAGTVLVEGTTLSEGRGTTRPLELFGAPDIDAHALLSTMHKIAPHWLTGCILRPLWFEPTFHKYSGQLCQGLFIHAEGASYVHAAFRPWRVQALAFKAIRTLWPQYDLWRDFTYEYESERRAIDVINGSPLLRAWVDEPQATPSDLDALARADEREWQTQAKEFYLY